MATVVVGDVHGNSAALSDLLDQLIPELTRDDCTVFLGDYIDRGPDAKVCIDQILQFQQNAPGTVIALMGNHEDWLLRTYRDYTRHSWLLGMEAFETIQSYSRQAERLLRAELERAGLSLITDHVRIPYEIFFSQVPAHHLSFLQNLRPCWRTPDAVCVHGGVNPCGAGPEEQDPEELLWGTDDFPAQYPGQDLIVYGHRNNAIVDRLGWPEPCVFDRTIGIDTISHGVLTAIRLPERRIFQSRRHRIERRNDSKTGNSHSCAFVAHPTTHENSGRRHRCRPVGVGLLAHPRRTAGRARRPCPTARPGGISGLSSETGETTASCRLPVLRLWISPAGDQQTTREVALRILAIADIHGATGVYEWLPEATAEYGVDLLILAGNLLIGGWEEEQSEQARTVIIPLLRTIPAPVCYIMGNDDHVGLDHEDERIKPVHGRRQDFGVCAVAGYQYSTPFVGGCHEKPDEEIAADLRQIEPLLDENTILVTHSPAYGYVDRIFSGNHVGSRALADLLARRNVLCHIHGHIHHSFGCAANHFNVAAGGRRRGMIIDVPSLSHFVIERR